MLTTLFSDNSNVHQSSNIDDNTINSENDDTIDIQQQESVEMQERHKMKPILKTKVVQDVQQSDPLLQPSVNAENIITIEDVETHKKPKGKRVKKKQMKKKNKESV